MLCREMGRAAAACTCEMTSLPFSVQVPQLDVHSIECRVDCESTRRTSRRLLFSG